ncbi:MAG: nicotinate-nucleotide--dimethylbenzimidazole phosphoribosyltransferase [Pseudomonadota bacterium]
MPVQAEAAAFENRSATERTRKAGWVVADTIADDTAAATAEPWWAAPAPRPCRQSEDAAAARQRDLTKPPGALGRLEDLAIYLAALQRTATPTADACEAIIFAADHGVTIHGVSPYPAEITAQMVANFARGGAAISVMARTLGVRLQVVDVGVARDPVLTADAGHVVTDKTAAGTADFTRQPAMSNAGCSGALAAGRRAVDRALATPTDVLILGDMGIGNTTAAAALTSVLTGRAPAEVTGPGTGLDPAGVSAKAGVIARALATHDLATPSGARADTAEGTAAHALRALTCVGGFEIAAIAGAAIAAAQAGRPVLVDGFIVTAALAVAVRLNPTIAPYMIFAHRSAEPGHTALLADLDAAPLLDLNLRLGEGTGAAAALPLLRLACATHGAMATFAEAGLTDGPVEARERAAP